MPFLWPKLAHPVLLPLGDEVGWPVRASARGDLVA